MSLDQSPRAHTSLVTLLAVLALAVAGTIRPAQAQEHEYQVGERVMVDVNMSSDPAYERWRPGTITGIEMWQGRVAGIFVRTDDGQDVGTHSGHLKPGGPPPPVAGSPPAGVQTAGGATAGVSAGSAGSARPAAAAPSKTAESSGRATAGVTAGVAVGASAGSGGAAGARPGGGAGSGALETGSYTCWTANGVAGTLKLVIRNGSQYADGQGKTGSYAYDAGSGRIEWKTGPWGGFYGTKLAPGKIGISSRPGGFSNTTCDRQ